MSDDTSRPHERTFLQKFCDKHNYEYHCIARPGATNFAINLQVDYAIKQRPDLIVMGATSSDRLNIVVDEKNRRAPLTIKNIIYKGYRCTSESELQSREEFVASDTLANLIESPYIEIPEEKKKAVKTYIAELHDLDLQYHIDGCVVRDALNKLIQSELPFVFIPGPMFPMGWNWVGESFWPADKTQPWDMPMGPGPNNNHNPPEAHDMFLEILEQILIDRKILKK